MTYSNKKQNSISDNKEISLDKLPISKSGSISSMHLENDFRRRLLDFGFTDNNTITPLYKSPLGDPIAFSIMGSIIALRSETASKIGVIPSDRQCMEGIFI